MQLPEWNKQGVKPPDSKINEGWQGKERPPAPWLNWLFYNSFKLLQERPDIFKQFSGEGFIVNGLEVTDATGLEVNISAGEANIAGHRFTTELKEGVTLADNETNYVYVALTIDDIGNIDSIDFEVNQTGTAPDNSLLLANATTDSGSITNITDTRKFFSTPTPDPDTLISRDAAGRAQVEDPSADKDITNKQTSEGYTDAHENKTDNIHGVTSSPTANKIIKRDSNGRAQVEDPSADKDIANKQVLEQKIEEKTLQTPSGQDGYDEYTYYSGYTDDGSNIILVNESDVSGELVTCSAGGGVTRVDIEIDGGLTKEIFPYTIKPGTTGSDRVVVPPLKFSSSIKIEIIQGSGDDAGGAAHIRYD